MSVSVDFSGGRIATASQPLWQYDYGQVVEFENTGLPDGAVPVHFEKKYDASAIVTTGTCSGGTVTATIPDQLLAVATDWNYDILGYIFPSTSTSGTTAFTAIFKVAHRSQAGSETPTPAQQSAWDQAIASLQEYEAAINGTVGNLSDQLDALEAEMSTHLREYLYVGSTGASEISSGADLNDFTTPGAYRASTNAIAKSLINSPTETSFRLIVTIGTSSTRLYQFALQNSKTSGMVFVRSLYDSTWSPWTLLANSGNTLGLEASNATLISSGDDLDTYTTAGNYVAQTNEIAASLVNSPVTRSFRLEVMETTIAGRIYQFALVNTNEIYFRNQVDGTWSDWDKVVKSSDLDSLEFTKLKNSTSDITWTTGSIKPDGSEKDDFTSNLRTDYVPVISGSKMRITGVDLRGGNRCICGYDESKTFVTAIVTGSTTTYPDVATNITITIPSSVKYIRTQRYTGTALDDFTVSYIDVNVDGFRDSSAQKLDDTLTSEILPAQAKAVGEAITYIHSQLSNYLYVGSTGASEITSGTDLNNIITPGAYRASTNAIAKSLINSPTETSFRLIVTIGTSSTRLYQFALQNSKTSGMVFVRALYDDTWSPWALLANSSNALGLLATGTISISDGADLDTYTTAGNYIALTNIVAASLVHSPVTRSFRLEVMETTIAGRIYQFVFENRTKNPGVYFRNRVDDTWSDWDKIVKLSDLDSLEFTKLKKSTSDITWTTGSIKPDGSEKDDFTSNLRTDYVPVISGSKMRITGVDLRGGNRCICGYDESKTFVTAIVTGSTTTYPDVATNITITIPSSVKYIRTQRYTGTTLDDFTMSYIDADIDALGGALEDALEDAVTKKCVKNADAWVSSSNLIFDDADDAPDNSIYLIAASAKMANTPYGTGVSTASGVYDGTYRSIAGYMQGTLITRTFFDGSCKEQFFIPFSTSNNNTAIYFRGWYSSSGWKPWRAVSDLMMMRSMNQAIRKKMIAPYIDSEGNPTATDTGISNPQCMINEPEIFDDFNDAPMNTIYQIDLDCDATVMKNNPVPGRSGALFTTGPIYVSRHAACQYYVCLLPNGNTRLFYRYGYIASSTSYVWTDWQQAVTVPHATVDGTYTLKATVTNGVATYTWEPV